MAGRAVQACAACSVRFSSMMAALLPLLLCCPAAAKVGGVGVIQFPPSVTVVPGETVTLRCMLESVRVYCHTVAWLQVHPESGTLHTSNRTSVTQTAERGAQICTRTVRNAAAHHAGTHYCAAVDNQRVYLGNGTAVRVQESPAPPAVEIVSVSGHRFGSTVRLQCLVVAQAWAAVRVFWVVGGREEQGRAESVWGNISGHDTHLIQSRLQLTPGGGGTVPPCTCIAQYGSRNITRTLQPGSPRSCYRVIHLPRTLGLTAALILLITACTVAHFTHTNTLTH